VKKRVNLLEKQVIKLKSSLKSLSDSRDQAQNKFYASLREIGDVKYQVESEKQNVLRIENEKLKIANELKELNKTIRKKKKYSLISQLDLSSKKN